MPRSMDSKERDRSDRLVDDKITFKDDSEASDKPSQEESVETDDKSKEEDVFFEAFDCFEDDENEESSRVVKKATAVEDSTSIEALLQGEKRDHDIDEDEKNLFSKKQKTCDILDDINPEEFSDRIKIHSVEGIEGCLHEVAVPPGMEFVMPSRSTLLDRAPAKEYSFLLDPFQKEAILCLENNQSVLVSAHTSAGKTVVAEYAIALSLREKQRVIYTTPIKALSNQKFREFSTEFKDVGLMTGDVTINPLASCLIMTTEILRSMLYRGSELLREVAFVIFDEIHYMRDKERGVVWEETIILLPDNVHYVFLSATIPNATQFAEWICHLHNQPCHVVYTDYRPVPLQQFIFPAGADGVFLVVDEKGNFLDSSFSKAMDALRLVSNTGSGPAKTMRTSVKGGDNIYKVVKMIMELSYAPVIVFSFSKKECEAYAVQMAKLDFNTKEEKSLVETVFWSAMDVLSPEDKKLPQVENVLPLLRRGIGIHHSGLLPILKETIEILFSEGLIKALFATETFAMGLNMPARTVLFTNVRKYDGKDFRWITSGEYIQMSGRAGRRGLDKSGIVIMMVDEKISDAAAKDIVKGLPDPINSAFHLTYNMVLNLLRVDDINPEFMLERSFFQFQSYSAIPKLYDELKKLKDEFESIKLHKEDEVASYSTIKAKLAELDDEIHSYIIKPQYSIPFIRSGRVVKVQNKKHDFGWGIAIALRKKSIAASAQDGRQRNETSEYIVDALIHVAEDSCQGSSTAGVRPPENSETGEMKVIPVALNMIRELSTVISFYPHDLRPKENRMRVLKILEEIKLKFPDGLPLLDPIKDMKIKDSTLHDLLKRKSMFVSRLKEHPMKDDACIQDSVSTYRKKMEIGSKMKEVKAKLKEAKSLVKMEDLKCRKRVLRRLGFCSATDVIQAKGRVACEISSADELLLTEMMFTGTFNDLDVHQTTALLSCFVFQEKSSQMPKLAQDLSGPLRHMQDIASKIAKISKECRLEVEVSDYVQSFKPHLMDVMYEWSKGKSFAHVCKMTDVFEGSIIRCLRRVEELLRQMCQAAKATGNTELENKFSEAIKCIKRDIAFAASLYL